MTQGLLPAHPASRALVDWLVERGTGPLPWQLRARLSWNAFWFERLLRAQTSARLDRASYPLFVMGFWRSGTTLLHNLLYERYVCTAPLTWQCFAPASFALQRPPTRDVSMARPMDDGIVHLLGPQEDEFALLLLGEPSLYRAFLDPGRMDEIADACLADEEFRLPRWQAFVAALANGDAPVLLKSPNHVFRLRTIERLWPGGAGLWICRPFAEVLISNLRMWGAMIDLHRLRVDAADLPALLARAASRYRSIVADMMDRPRGPMLWLDYADLATEPDTTSAAAASFLGLAPRTVPLDGVDTAVHAGRTTRAPELPGEQLSVLAGEIDRLHATALSRWGRKR